MEYRALQWLDLRAGYSLENEPMPNKYVDYLVPSSDRRHNFSIGTGFRWQATTMDLAYTLVYMPDRTVNNSLAIGVLPSNLSKPAFTRACFESGYKF